MGPMAGGRHQQHRLAHVLLSLSTPPDSTGVAAALGATGSSSVAANDLMLEGVGLPTNAFGFFLTSRSQGFVQNPGGSQGNFCLGGAIGRYIGPGQVQNSGLLGLVSLGINLDQMPRPTGPMAVQPGDTWYFQFWHRDGSASGPGSWGPSAARPTVVSTGSSSGLRRWAC